MNFLYRELLTTTSPLVQRCGKPIDSFSTRHALRLNIEPASAANKRAPDFPLYYISTPAFLETLP